MTRTSVVVLVIAVSLSPLGAEARGPATTTFLWSRQHHESDQEAIRRVIDDATAAWNAGNAAAFAAHFATDGTFTIVTGMSSSGSKAFAARHDELLKTLFKGSSLKQTIRQLRFLAKDVALVEVDMEVTGYAGLPPGVKAWPDGVLRMRLQEVLVKVVNDWWIEGYHTVDVKLPELQG